MGHHSIGFLHVTPPSRLTLRVDRLSYRYGFAVPRSKTTDKSAVFVPVKVWEAGVDILVFVDDVVFGARMNLDCSRTVFYIVG